MSEAKLHVQFGGEVCEQTITPEVVEYLKKLGWFYRNITGEQDFIDLKAFLDASQGNATVVLPTDALDNEVLCKDGVMLMSRHKARVFYEALNTFKKGIAERN